MSLLKTKPKWCQLAVASEQGWINSNTGELLVSHRGLKSKLEAEEKEKEIIMEKQEVQVEVKQIQEQTVKKPKKNQKIIAEVVEYKIDKTQEVIGE